MKQFPPFAIACFYILTGCIICSALFLYGSSLWKHPASASSGSVFEVSASEEDSAPEGALVIRSDDVEAEDAPEEHYYSFVTLNVRSGLHVRVQPGMDAEILSRLAPGTAGYVLERGDDWSLIKASDVIGYVSNQYLQFQEIPKDEYLSQAEGVSQ